MRTKAIVRCPPQLSLAARLMVSHYTVVSHYAKARRASACETKPSAVLRIDSLAMASSSGPEVSHVRHTSRGCRVTVVADHLRGRIRKAVMAQQRRLAGALLAPPVGRQVCQADAATRPEPRRNADVLRTITRCPRQEGSLIELRQFAGIHDHARGH